jgi:predicted ATPase/class 3 adenylate cyclase
MDATTNTTRRTFLFTDIESSTRLWDHFPEEMLTALDQHDRLLADVVGRHRGTIIRHTGDGIIGVFLSGGDAVEAAGTAQRQLGETDWGAVDPLRVRMGVHTGEVVIRNGEHHGWALNCASRLHALARGGQVVVSGATMADVDAAVLQRLEFVDLGMHHLRDVAEPMRVYVLDAPDSPLTFEGLRDSARRVAGLPRPLTSFVGRGEDLGAIAREVLEHRVVTLVGVPGVGKTRLSIEVAQALSASFADGVVMCELAGVEPSQVGVALAKALGVERRSMRSAEESIVEWMRDKQLLVILDACEGATRDAGELAFALMRGTNRAHVLANSHEPLSVESERVMRLRPLEVVGGSGDAIELFLQRADAAGARILDDARTRGLVRELCDAVAGLPLSIEIAASNAGSLSLLDILDAVRAGELPGVAGAGHRGSVDDALDLTFGRLDAASREAFLRCAVFNGSFDRVAFAVVAGSSLNGAEVLGVLRTLVDRSLITSETRRERTRFRLLEPVRAYAEHRCPPDQLAAARAAFVAHYVDLAERAAVSMRGPDEARWAEQLELDFDHLRTAHRHGLSDSQADSSLRIVTSLWDFAFMHMRSEYFDWSEEAVEAPSDHPLRAMGHGVVALGAWMREHPAKAVSFANESLRLERETGATKSVPARMALMNSAEYGGAEVDVRALMLEMLEITRQSSSPYWQVNADGMRVLSLAFAGRTEQGIEMAATVMAAARASENPSTLAWAMFIKGMVIEGVDVDHAEALFEEGLERARSVENGWVGAMCSTRLASLRRRRGSWADALTMLSELLDTWERAGHRAHLWAAINQVALCLADAGDLQHAAMLHEASNSSVMRAPKLPAERADDEACLARAREAAGESQWRRWAFRGTDLDQVAAVALARQQLGAAIVVSV